MLSQTFLLDAFAVSARDIADADVNSLLALSLGVGWHHRAEDWEFMREVGQGRVAMDETGRVHGAAMWFPFGDRHATIGLVITTPRLQMQGGAQWLMGHVLEQTQGRALGLHATKQSHRMFLSLGFVDEGTVYQYQGNVGTPPQVPDPADAEIRTFSHADVPVLRDLDRAATGWKRDTLIDALVARSRGTVLTRAGKIEACALMRAFGRGMVIGPIFAGNEEDALRVLYPLMVDRAGSFARIDIADQTSRLADFAAQCGLQVGEKVTRMSFGAPWPFSNGSAPFMFSLASQATG